MPRDASGKNKKWGRHKEKEVEDVNEEVLMRASKGGVVDDDKESDEEGGNQGQNEPQEEKKVMEIKPKVRTMPESSSSDEEEAKPQKGPKPVIEVSNPNREKKKANEGVTLTKKQKEELDQEKALRKELKDIKLNKSEEAQAEFARLAEIRRKREEAKKDKEEEEARQAEQKKKLEEQSKSFKKA